MQRMICHNLPMCGRYRLSRRKQIIASVSGERLGSLLRFGAGGLLKDRKENLADEQADHYIFQGGRYTPSTLWASGTRDRLSSVEYVFHLTDEF